MKGSSVVAYQTLIWPRIPHKPPTGGHKCITGKVASDISATSSRYIAFVMKHTKRITYVFSVFCLRSLYALMLKEPA